MLRVCEQLTYVIKDGLFGLARAVWFTVQDHSGAEGVWNALLDLDNEFLVDRLKVHLTFDG